MKLITTYIKALQRIQAIQTILKKGQRRNEIISYSNSNNNNNSSNINYDGTDEVDIIKEEKRNEDIKDNVKENNDFNNNINKYNNKKLINTLKGKYIYIMIYYFYSFNNGDGEE